mgnify:FL=1|jgi:twin arginine-targeting protein translocase, TatA/E family
MGLSIWQILIVVVLLVLLFGRGKISELMGDVAKGIKSFKKGLNEEEKAATIEEGKGETLNMTAQEEESKAPEKSEK